MLELIIVNKESLSPQEEMIQDLISIIKENFQENMKV